MKLFRPITYVLFIITTILVLSLHLKFAIPDNRDFSSGHIQEIFRKLAINSGSMRVHPLIILDSEIVNAWTDGKNITITTGLLHLMNNEDELAMVLGHEIAHDLNYDVLHRYLFGELDPMMQTEKEANADKLGAFIMMRAGFNVCKGKNIMKVFRDNFGDDSIVFDHPSNAYRLDQLNLPQCH